MAVVTGSKYSTQFQVLVDGILTNGTNLSGSVQINGTDYPSSPEPEVILIETGRYLVVFDAYEDWVLNDSVDVTLSLDVEYNGTTYPVSDQKLVGLYGSIPAYDADVSIIVDSAFGDLAFTSDDLILGENSSITLEQAQYAATINSKLSGWNSLDLHDRVAALLSVQEKLNCLCFKIEGVAVDYGNGCPDPHIRLGDLPAEDFALLPDSFLSALASAAVSTAMSDMACDSAEAQRADGIMQTKSGESSHMYRPGMPMRFPLPADVMWKLSPWLCNHKPRMGRTS